ncbi:MAG: hypothetical protein LBG59_00775 [Candidatus Peribacteria bacterium]|jgi:hypothetical protein|nr:hypothetical protein [Candidatus Peribacteria bacterium]
MGDTIYYTSGNVGIGITTPNDKLHVNGNIIADGGIKVGTTTATCNSSTEGTLKYTENCLFYCNGDEWKEISCPEPINGICGSINETTASSKPTSNLCAAGTASTVNGN